MSAPQLSRARIATCILINLAATPGLGSISARRYVAGTFQLILSVAGFCLIVGWMFKAMFGTISDEISGQNAAVAPGWMWKWGAILFGAAWLWSLVTSISMWRESKPESVPPKLSDLQKPKP
ncbi:MAG TPA: hypothetical protein VFV23_10310 [Verrucomicrobiae bacterium]|nr:hypothetical protein [Verrucomicrobiae bacterium]